MDYLSLIIMILKFLFGEMPRLIEAYKKASLDNRYNNEAERIEGALNALKTSQGRDKLKHLGELEK